MKTDQHTDLSSVFLQSVSNALRQLKQQLRRNYERTYPDLGEVIHLVLEQEEANAWNLSPFPHLLFPDLVEAHIANLNLEPVETKHDAVLESRYHFDKTEIGQPAFALCG